MKKKHVLFFLLILVLLSSVICFKFVNQNTKNKNIADKTIVVQTLSRENFKIKKLYLEKCKDTIADEKLIGIRFILDYIYTSPSILQNDVFDIKIKIIFPEDLTKLLMTDMLTINILCNNLNSSKLANTNYEIYGKISEADVARFINQQNQFRLMVYENDVLIDQTTIKNIIDK